MFLHALLLCTLLLTLITVTILCWNSVAPQHRSEQPKTSKTGGPWMDLRGSVKHRLWKLRLVNLQFYF
uniref:Uncharacterized protein n=1 Tax=Scleropages formosus TaxID=113540 RepID=A0A8C9VIM1_SCLFO